MRAGILIPFILLSISAFVLPLRVHLTLQSVKATSALPSDMPVVFVDPLGTTADVGDTFAISVKVFNLSARAQGL